MFDLNSLSNTKIMVIGDIMLDRYLWGKVKRISPEAPVPIVQILECSEVLGGAGNVAANIAGLGCSPFLIGICGKDEAGKRLVRMADGKKNRTRIFVDPSRRTIKKTRVMGQNQQMLRLDEEDTQVLNAQVKEQLLSIFNENYEQYDAVILSDYGKGIFETQDVAQHIISQCRKHHLPVFIDPKGDSWERYDSATCITPNSNELSHSTGMDFSKDDNLVAQLVESTRKRHHFDWCLLTLGARGMCLSGRDREPIIIPTQARKVYDVSGAGDTVIATLAVGVASGLSFSEAAKLANYAAGVVVGKLGTQPINKDELRLALRIAKNELPLTVSNKLATPDNARLQVDAWRAYGEKIVFTNGCFDLLHPGHIHLLNQASHLGNRLIVGLNTDASIKTLKGEERPILCEQDRASMLSGLSYIDLIILFDEDTPISLIKSLKPDILVKGSDYQSKEVVGRKYVESYGGQVELIQLIKGHSTTKLINRELAHNTDG